MEVSDTQVLKKVDLLIDKVDGMDKSVSALSQSLDEHKKRHALVMDMLMTVGKLMIGVPTFLTMIGGAIYGLIRLIKGGA
jgi:hypothetical protein